MTLGFFLMVFFSFISRFKFNVEQVKGILYFLVFILPKKNNIIPKTEAELDNLMEDIHLQKNYYCSDCNCVQFVPILHKCAVTCEKCAKKLAVFFITRFKFFSCGF